MNEHGCKTTVPNESRKSGVLKKPYFDDTQVTSGSLKFYITAID